MQSNPMNNILVIDEVPTIALGLQEIFRTISNGIRVEQVENVFTALSSRSYEGKKFDLIIIGEQTGHPSENLPRTITECKNRFGSNRVMIYSSNYDHAIIEKMEESGIDAYIHKYEPIEEIRKAYACLKAGEGYISGIFHTLYYEYCLRLDKLPPPKDQPGN
jgi:DNA-binding NarL/FixJ family response regulator